MTTTGAVIVVGGVGLAAFLYFRSQSQQAAALGAAGVGTTSVGPVAGNPTTGTGSPSSGGAKGLVNGLWVQWKGDPLGIKNTKAALSTGYGVVKTGAHEVGHLASSIVGGIKGIL